MKNIEQSANPPICDPPPLREPPKATAGVEQAALLRRKLGASLLEFSKVMHYLRTGKKFRVSQPIGRQSHHLEICRALVKVMRGEITRLIIQIPPRYGKTELLCNFVAWGMAQYPDSQFLYVSYSLGLARKATAIIKRIMSLREYQVLFDVHIARDATAKGNFETTYGGAVYAAGAQGEITGRGAGLSQVPRFGGAIVIDDIHKPADIHSDVLREGVKNWYYETLMSRVNDPRHTPIILVGQALHEDDLPENLKSLGTWDTLILPALDGAGHELDPRMHTAAHIRDMLRVNPYVTSAQYQQTPISPSSGLFQRDWIVQLPEPPACVATFLTVDTAETAKTYNDATVFSFWGLYQVEREGFVTPLYALHWLDCYECRVEPAQLLDEFNQFYYACCRYKVAPTLVAIEKKSTGTALLSFLRQQRGIRLWDVQRHRGSHTKIDRYIHISDLVAQGYVSIDMYASHKELVLSHLSKITAANTHRHDDIADTLYDAIILGLVEKVVVPVDSGIGQQVRREASAVVAAHYQQIADAKRGRYG